LWQYLNNLLGLSKAVPPRSRQSWIMTKSWQKEKALSVLCGKYFDDRRTTCPDSGCNSDFCTREQHKMSGRQHKMSVSGWSDARTCAQRVRALALVMMMKFKKRTSFVMVKKRTSSKKTQRQ
jgi:hypothetical protein